MSKPKPKPEPDFSQMSVAKLGHLKAPRQEYKLNTKEGNALGENVDTLEFLNEIGQDGWIAMEIREMVVGTGMVDDKGEQIKKVVLAVLSRRPVYTSEAE